MSGQDYYSGALSQSVGNTSSARMFSDGVEQSDQSVTMHGRDWKRILKRAAWTVLALAVLALVIFAAIKLGQHYNIKPICSSLAALFVLGATGCVGKLLLTRYQQRREIAQFNAPDNDLVGIGPPGGPLKDNRL